jgi:hypothetical protein
MPNPKGSRRPRPRQTARAATAVATAPSAQQLAAERAAAAPIPSSYRAVWWPAAVKLPDLDTPVRLAKVYATAEGLYVYTAAPVGIEARADGRAPFWFAPINYGETPRPATGYAASRAGVQLATSVGTVSVQALGGCGCGNGALKAWRPDWAQRVEAWEASA